MKKKPVTKKRTKKEPETLPVFDGLERAIEPTGQGVPWLWEDVIPAGCLGLVEGKKNVGKSSVLASIAASIACGTPFPCGTKHKAAPVIWDNREESWEKIVVPKLKAAGVPIPMLFRPRCRDTQGRKRRLSLPGDMLILEEVIRASGAKLLVLDPFGSVADPGLNLKDEQHGRLYAEPIQDLMDQMGCNCLMSRHLKKGKGHDPRDAGLGGVAIGNVARTIVTCGEHPSKKDIKVAAVTACNYAKKLVSFEYQIKDTASGFGVVEWLGPSEVTAQDLMNGLASEAEADEWTDADRLFRAKIGDEGCPFKELLAEAEQAGISPSMMRRVKSNLRIPSIRVVRGAQAYWEWGPPPNGWPAGLEAP